MDPSASPACAVVLAADDPADLARFYGALLQQPPAVGLAEHHWRLALPGGGRLEIYRPSRTRPRPRQPGRLSLCLQRPGDADGLAAWIRQAEGLGAALLEGPRQESFGVEAWLADPEGNRLLLLVLAPRPGSTPGPAGSQAP
ncbi:MAG: VOC family protein [Synechococcaceae bacterium WB8_1B_136]|nr:VOC family protein [Synechococcaceae bacterium WB8_1B_136]